MKKIIRNLLDKITNTIDGLKTKLEKKSTTILPLSPRIIKAQYIEQYTKRLNKAIETEDINNIAITGNYGTGKSSIIKTFINKYNIPDKEIIKINIANYFDEIILEKEKAQNGSNDNQVNEEIKDKKTANNNNRILEPNEIKVVETLEDTIVRQLLFCKKNDNNYETTIKSLSSEIKRKSIIMSAFYIGLMLFLFISYKLIFVKNSKYFINVLNKIIPIIDTSSIVDTVKTIALYYVWPFMLILLAVTAIYILYNIVIILLKNIKNGGLSIKSSAITIDIQEDMSFAKNLREIVLFFSHNKKCRLVIFEDIDRFPKDIVLKLMEELKKLNSQINASETVKQKVTFIYTFKDDIFKKKEDKCKFYDYIVSIMPVASYYNSFEILKDLLSKVDKDSKIDDELIELVADYVYDYRTLISIVNDYDLFKDIHGEINENKLFAMVIIKNCYVDEYNNILEHDNFIEEKFNKIDKSKSLIIKNIESEISEVIKQIEKIEEEYEFTIEDLKKLFWENCNSHPVRANYIKNADTGDKYTYQEFLTDFNIEDLNEYEFLFDGSYSLDYQKYGSKEEFLEKAIPKKKRIKSCQLMIDELESQKKDVEKHLTDEQYKDYTQQQKIEMIDRLIISNYIERDYVDYITSPSSITTGSENTYIFNVKHGYASILTPIENYALVLERVSKHIKSEYVLNIHIIDYVLNNNQCGLYKEDILNQFLSMTEHKLNVLLYLYKEKNDSFYKVMEHIIKNKVDIWEQVKKSEDEIKEIVTMGLLKVSKGITTITDETSFILYLNQLFNDYNKVSLLDDELIFDNIKETLKYKLRIKDISLFSYKIQDIIKEYALYEYNDKNMMNIYWQKKNIIEEYTQTNKYGKKMIEHINNNFLVFYNEYYIKNKEIQLGEFVIDIIKKDIQLDIKCELYKREKFIVDIATIKEKELYLLAIEHNHVEVSWSTIYKLNYNIQNNILVEFIMKNKMALLGENTIKKEKDIEKCQYLLKELLKVLILEKDFNVINNLRPYCKFKIGSIYEYTNEQIIELNKINMIDFDKAKINRIKNISNEQLEVYLKHWIESDNLSTVYNKVKRSEDSKNNIKIILKLDNIEISEKLNIVFKEKKNLETTTEYLKTFIVPSKTYKIQFKRSLYTKMTNEYNDAFKECKKDKENIYFKI